MRECEICHSTEKIVFHHLSYDPEMGIDVCRKCHFALHCIDVDVFPKIMELKKKYGHLWVNGNEQYQKSKRFREVQKLYRKTEKAKEGEKRIRQSEEFKKKRKEYLMKNREVIAQRKREQYLKYKRENPDKLKEINRRAGKRYYEKTKTERVAFRRPFALLERQL
jgi:hypothetical protein